MGRSSYDGGISNVIVKRGIDENGVAVTTLFGFAIRDVLSGVGFATLGGAIWWTANLNYRVDSIGRALINPSDYARLEAKVDTLRAKQDEVLAGATIPQNLMRERIARIETEVAGLNIRCTNTHTEINSLERIVDKLVIKLESIEKKHEKEAQQQNGK